MKKICFIIPHFGKFNNYFPLFLKTCGWNKDFNWLVFTDDRTEYDYPDNFKVVYLSFGELREKIQAKFEFPIALERPYKLCDYRPLYGYLFSDYLNEYTHWGHCDTDTIMGKLNSFITEEMLLEYDKIFQLGHLSIYKNTQDMFRVVMSKFEDREIGKEIFQNEKNCWFDEEWDPIHNIGIHKLMKAQGKKIFKEDLSLNISMSYNHFRRGKFVGTENTTMPYGFEIEAEKEALYLWENGNLYRLYEGKTDLIREDFPYIHLQKRRMRLHHEVLELDRFKIVPDEFLPVGYSYISYANFNRIRKYGRCWHTQRMMMERIVKKIKGMWK